MEIIHLHDLIEILEEENYSPSEIVEILSSIDRNDVEEYALQHMICPRCYSRLEIHIWDESRGEYWGFPARETMAEYYCPGCKADY
jgi:rubrerythrin